MSEKQQETKRAELEKVFDIDEAPRQVDGRDPLIVRFSNKPATALENFQRDEAPDNSVEVSSITRAIESEFDVPTSEAIRKAARRENEETGLVKQARDYGAQTATEFLRRNPDATAYFPNVQNWQRLERYIANLQDETGEPVGVEDLEDAFETLVATGELVSSRPRQDGATGLSERQQAPRPTKSFDKAVEQQFIDAAKNAPTAAEAVRIANEGLSYLSNRPAPVADGDSEF